ncbi:leucyl aminopeptidase family protein [Paraneptunicella aestuarii]|uniref:leucyl aminopeptidase family protein n=1 Tax=Paraneptunicella aestuarii TaxID=2831148 RepID=UPI001E59559B|nr:leucyl aminopeptidase family protein [Paraneptunicella aestuarii]UAA39579.1 leucyl aminopeptidase family protein [Paraneptunicella aestuarii]
MSYPIAVRATVDAITDVNGTWDAVIYISPSATSGTSSVISEAIFKYADIDKRVGVQPMLLPAEGVAGGRIIFAPTGNLMRYFDDVRRYGDAAHKAAKIAKDAGIVNPLLVVETPNDWRFQHALEVAYLQACQSLWQPLEARESLNEAELEPVNQIGLVHESVDADWLVAVEGGRRLARDLCGTNPERMAPPGFADYCVDAFAGTDVKVEVISSQEQLQEEYPLLAAVARAAVQVERHHARVVTLTYEPEGEVTQSLYLAGKGVTYDTGGADLKTGGFMAGMSRDKGGAAAVAGLMKTVAMLKPKGIKVVAELGLVRNSIGSDAFVSDEIITSRAGVRVRIGNTDAEGRLVLSDVLTHLKELAEGDDKAEFFSVATLTGHAARAVGPYTALVENGFARANRSAQALSDVGDLWGDAAEVSRSRREDFDFVAPRSKADDVLSSNNAASAVTPRGHQFPMAFLCISSGLDKVNAPYTHVDIAGSGVEKGDWQHGKPTASPVTMLAARYFK